MKKTTTKKSSYTKEVIIRSYDWALRHVDYGPKKLSPISHGRFSLPRYMNVVRLSFSSLIP
jgi:hypothetical protein